MRRSKPLKFKFDVGQVVATRSSSMVIKINRRAIIQEEPVYWGIRIKNTGVGDYISERRLRPLTKREADNVSDCVHSFAMEEITGEPARIVGRIMADQNDSGVYMTPSYWLETRRGYVPETYLRALTKREIG